MIKDKMKVFKVADVEAAIVKAEKADLITFSEDIADGVKCGNCMYVDIPNNWCLHKAVDQELADGPERMCCSFWDRVGTIRTWEEEPRSIDIKEKNIKKLSGGS